MLGVIMLLAFVLRGVPGAFPELGILPMLGLMDKSDRVGRWEDFGLFPVDIDKFSKFVLNRLTDFNLLH